MAIRSYSNAMRAKVNNNLVVNLKMMLPNNISPNIKEEIYSILSSTKFEKLPINISATRSLLKIRDNRENMRNKAIPIGFIRTYNLDANEFTVMIFGSLAENIKDIINPAIEVVYSEMNDKLITITRFNLISLGSTNISYDPEDDNYSEMNDNDNYYDHAEPIATVGDVLNNN